MPERGQLAPDRMWCAHGSPSLLVSACAGCSPTLTVAGATIAGVTTCAVLALKPVSGAKTRFTQVPPALRAALVMAMALDVARALVEACAEVLIVSDEPTLGTRLRAAGIPATVVAEPATPGLNAALAYGAGLAAEHDAVLACVADLPGLRAGLLQPLLATTGPGRWFVPDLESTGTTMLLARGEPLRPGFEGASAARHAASGARPLSLAADARRDVDTLADLAEVAEPGPHTGALLVEGSLGQWRGATVVADGLVLDDGTRVNRPVGDGLRLHPGQRVHTVGSADRVTHLWW